MYGICLLAIGSFPVLLFFLAYILSPFPCIAVFFNKSFLNRLALGCEASSRPLGRGCEHYPSFRVENEISWLRALSPQCHGIIASCALMVYALAESSLYLLFSHGVADVFGLVDWLACVAKIFTFGYVTL
jgi:hypothetical protein